ncbi:MAG: ABC transporter ATP-binding protein, partial [Candidatus Schekmanbacteria bacterium]
NKGVGIQKVKRLKLFLRFNKYLLPYWDKEAVILICTLFATLFSLISPYLTKITIDYAYTNRDFFLFNMLVLSGALIFIFSGLLNGIKNYVSIYVKQLLTFDIRSDYYRHLHKLSIRFFQSRSTGEQMYRIGGDINNVASMATETIPTILTTCVRLVFLFVITFTLSWKLTLIALLITPLFYLHSHYFGEKLRERNKEMTEKGQDILSSLQDVFSNIRLIKVFGKERSEIKRYLTDQIDMIRLSLKNYKMGVASGSTLSIMNTVVMTSLSYYAGYLVIIQELTLGSLTALVLYLVQLFGLLKSLGSIYQGVVIKFVNMERLAETFDAEVEVKERTDAFAIKRIRGNIEFRDVAFGYKENEAILKDLSFQIEPHAIVGIVGKSGAGKTTILNLILRLYDPWKGSILIDGMDLRDLKLKDLREKIGVVFQEPYLLNGTIAENISFGNPKATKKEIIEAAELADAHDFIKNFPDAYDSEIGEGGCSLSQGQKQRIAIARALIKKPDLLLLDEATSSLGSDSEAKIKKTIFALKDECTIIWVSHRISTIMDADTIFVLDNGRISSCGTHNRLLEDSPFYRRIYNEQFKITGKPYFEILRDKNKKA